MKYKLLNIKCKKSKKPHKNIDIINNHSNQYYYNNYI